MKVSRSMQPSSLLSVVVLTLSLLLISGCSGGWGIAQPKITAITGQAVSAGQTATLSVTPTGIGPYTYQWYKNGVPIPGATSSSYSVLASASDNGASFTVGVTNAAGTVVSPPYIMNSGTAPSFSAQPSSQSVSAGQPATFSVAASGTGPFTYQWLKNGSPINGATSSSLTTAATSLADDGTSYTVVITSALGQVTSSPAVLSVAALAANLSFTPVGPQSYGATPMILDASSASLGVITYTVVSGPATLSGSTLTITGVGTVVLSASQAASGNFAASTQMTSFTVSPAAPALALAPIANTTFGATATAAASSNSPSPILYSIASGPATIVGNVVITTGVGTITVLASQAATVNFSAGTATGSFNVTQATPSVSFTQIGAHTYGDPPFTVNASSPSTGAVTYTIVSGPATVSGNTVTLTGAGTVVLSASQAADPNYAASSDTTSFTVAAGTPTLSFRPVPAHTYGDPAFAISASSPSTGAVVYTVVSGPATVSGNVVTLTGAGTVVLSASQAADSNYAASTAAISFAVASANPTLSFTSVAPHSFGDPAFTVTASSPSTGSITYTVVSGPAIVSGNTVTLTGAGTVVLSASQAADSNYAASTANTSFTVAAASLALSFTPVASHTYGDPAFTINATSPSTGAIIYAVSSGPATIAGNTVTPTGVGTVTVTASQAATANYASGTASTTFTVTAATPTLSLASIGNQTYGATATASATSNSPGAITYTVTGPATVSGSTITTTGVGTVTVTASQAATANYASGTASTTFTVTAATPTLSLASIGNQTYGATATASATSNSPGAITYTVTGPATVSGSTITTTGVGTVTVTASQAATANYASGTASTTFTVTAATPTLSLASIGNQTYGATATASATSNSPGAITYTVTGPATVSGSTITTTGVGTVTVTASQAATANYASGTASTTFTVTAATPTLSLASIGNQTYGAAATASATSNSPGAITYTVTGPATVSGSTITTTGVGTVTVTASQAATANYASGTASTTFTVTAATPTLSLASIGNQTYGATATASATSNSPGAITYTVTGPATVSGSTITTTGVGTVTVTASQAATANYASGTASTTFTVTAATPTLSLASIGNQTYGATATASATSNSPGAITYTVTGPATVSGSTITTTGVGTVTVTASQAATANYASGTASTTFTVTAATPTLSLASIGNQTYGATATASATSNSPGAITYTVTGPATVSGSTITTTGVGTVTVTASQAATANYASGTASTTFTVTAATPTLSLASIGNQTYGATATASATSNSPGAITYTVTGPATVSGSTITTTGVGTVTVTASQAATTNYAAATEMTSFNVGKASPALAFTNVATHYAGDAPFAVSASSASFGAVTYIVTSGPATISGPTVTLTGTGTVVLGASQAATTNYTSATASTSFNVAQNVSISAISPSGQTIAPQPVTFSATASGGQTNSVSWSATGGTFSGSIWTPPNTAGTYTITATSADEPSITATATITVSKPVITTQPVSKNACAGYSPSVTLGANYATSYQWYMNGNTLANTTNILSFPNATTSNSGTYTCAAINNAGYVTSNAVSLNVVNPTTLTLTNQPSSVTVYATQTATFAVAATGTGTLQYQWYTGIPGSGTAISGATSRTFTTGALGAGNSGTTYYVTVTDPDCTNSTVSSNAATLTVSSTNTAVPPTIVTQPVSLTATVGGTATFSVTASGSGTLSYQWYRVAYTSNQLTNPTAGVLISGATNSNYTVPSSRTAQSNDGDNYYVVVSNNYGSATSSRAMLATGPGIVLQITAQPQTTYVSASTLASFSVGATCTGCTPAYRWYWYAPGATTAVVLSNGSGSGTLAGATISGAQTSSLTLQNVPTTATGGLVYAIVTSTSDGTSQIVNTNPLTTSTAGLFVGSLGSVGNNTTGHGLCNTGFTSWVLNGNSPGTSSASSNVPYQNTSGCTMEMTNGGYSQYATVYWPTLVSTANFSVSFTVQISSSGTPADGFTMVLADPSQGATTSTVGALGEGMGADGIPGFVLGFDTFQNGTGGAAAGCYFSGSIPCDPVTVPYMAVGQGAASLWENPWTFVNGALNTQSSSNYSPSAFANATHSYVVTVVNHVMTVTMDGYELFTGTVSLPPAAYLGFTASTGGSTETVIFSNLTATISAP